MVCWSSTSSALVGMRISSMSPARMRWTVTAVFTRSARCLG